MSSEFGGDLLYRKALLSDFEAVMDLGDMFDGRDYLWALYKDMVLNPKNHCIVVVAKSDVVGFGLGSTIDGGLTLAQRAGRVSKEFKGRGIFLGLQDVMDQYKREERPQAIYDVFTTRTDKDGVERQQHRPGYKPVLIRGAVTMLYRHNQTASRQTELYKPERNIKELGYNDLKLIFYTGVISHKLFPKGRLFNFYVGYRAMEANIDNFINKWCGVFATFKEGNYRSKPELSEQSSNHRYQPTRLKSKGSSNIDNSSDTSTEHLDLESLTDIDMVSFYICFPVRNKGFYVMVDVYTRPDATSSDQHLKTHLVETIDTIQTRFPRQDGLFTVTFDLPLNRDRVLSCLGNVGIDEIMPKQEKYSVLWERETGKAAVSKL